MTLQEFEAKQLALERKLEPCTIYATSILEVRPLVERIYNLFRQDFSMDWLMDNLEHENEHAISALRWAKENKLEISVKFAVYMAYSITKDKFFNHKKVELLPGVDFPDIALRVNYDKNKFLDFYEAVLNIKNSSSYDLMMVNGKASRDSTVYVQLI
jgi:hypothetical protein